MSTHTEDEQVITTLSTEEIIDQRENPIKTLRQSEAFQYMMLEYGAALKIVETKLHALDSEFNLRHDRNPIESISTRLKSADSIVEKMHRRGQPVSIESIQKSLTDIAGARVICSFLDDIYTLADMIKTQEDITVHVKKRLHRPSQGERLPQSASYCLHPDLSFPGT